MQPFGNILFLATLVGWALRAQCVPTQSWLCRVCQGLCCLLISLLYASLSSSLHSAVEMRGSLEYTQIPEDITDFTMLEIAGSLFGAVSLVLLERSYDFEMVWSYGDGARMGCIHPSGAYRILGI